jgi:hypothetical protein
LSQLLHHRKCRQLHHASGVASDRTISKDDLTSESGRDWKADICAHHHNCGLAADPDLRIRF